MPAALTSPSSRPGPALDLGDDALPVGLGGDVERKVDAAAGLEIAGNRRAAGGFDGGGNRAARSRRRRR